MIIVTYTHFIISTLSVPGGCNKTELQCGKCRYIQVCLDDFVSYCIFIIYILVACLKSQAKHSGNVLLERKSRVYITPQSLEPSTEEAKLQNAVRHSLKALNSQ